MSWGLEEGAMKSAQDVYQNVRDATPIMTTPNSNREAHSKRRHASRDQLKREAISPSAGRSRDAEVDIDNVDMATLIGVSTITREDIKKSTQILDITISP